MNGTDVRPHRLLSVQEVAVYLNWPRLRASRWLKKHGIAKRDGRRYVVALSTFLEHFPDAREHVLEAAMGLNGRTGVASDIERMEQRLLSAERRIRGLESSLRKMREQRRKWFRNIRRRKTQDSADTT